MIRFLGREERQKTRALYEEAFPEDSPALVDYYYKWKIKDNEIVAMDGREPGGPFQAMLHLNPYRLRVYGQLQEIPYIVAVATEEGCRRQGKMRQVMEAALKELHGRGTPFAFLLPKDPAYYEGQGFVFLPPTGDGGSWGGAGDLSAAPAGEDDLLRMAEFANKALEWSYDIYVERDADYYRRLLEETAVEHGGVLLLRREGEIEGILAYGDEDGKIEVKEALAGFAGNFPDRKKNVDGGIEVKSAFLGREARFSPMRMMARIVDLRALVPLLRSGEPRSLRARILDPIVPANNGCFEVRVGPEGGSVRQIPERNADREMDISGLARLLFAQARVFLNEWV